MLKGKGLLTPLQKEFLSIFSGIPDQECFYLTGGTALSEFYLGHRHSFDLGLFTSDQEIILPVSYKIQELCIAGGLDVMVTRRFASYVEFVISRSDESVKIDLALDSPFRFAPPEETESGVLVNDFQDLQVDKLLAYYGRAEPRDAVDLFFILQNASADSLFELAAQKDPGFDLYWFAIALNRAESFPDEIDRWPVKMIKKLDAVEVKHSFQAMALTLMGKIT
jgi:predicted nucleotidyltransferase component of viral defense system